MATSLRSSMRLRMRSPFLPWPRCQGHPRRGIFRRGPERFPWQSGAGAVSRTSRQMFAPVCAPVRAPRGLSVRPQEPSESMARGEATDEPPQTPPQQTCPSAASASALDALCSGAVSMALLGDVPLNMNVRPLSTVCLFSDGVVGVKERSRGSKVVCDSEDGGEHCRNDVQRSTRGLAPRCCSIVALSCLAGPLAAKEHFAGLLLTIHYASSLFVHV